MLAALLADEAFGVMLVFARVGTVLMLAPGFGERYVLPRLRLLLGLLVSVLLQPALAPTLPPVPADPLGLGLLLGQELALGMLMGFTMRLVMAALHMGGTIVAMQAGFAAAAYFDPHEATHGAITANLLTMLLVVLLFTTGLHHEILRGIVASYQVLPIGAPVATADMAETVVRLSSAAVGLAVRIGAPLLIAGSLANLALGAVNRLMPSFQVFVVAVPLQLLLGLVLILMTLAAAAHLALGFLGQSIAVFAGAG